MKRGLALMACGLVLATAAACGGPSSSGGPSPAGSGGPSSSFAAHELAFARCVRAHGVPSFPDPDANGQEPASTKNLASVPQFAAASAACRYLIQSDIAALNRADLRTYVRFAECMRAHGLPKFPDPATKPDGAPEFDLSATVRTQSPQALRATASQCQSLLHLASLPSYRT